MNELINPNGSDSQSVIARRSRRPPNIWLIIVAALFIIVPFLTWYVTWFGRNLSDNEIAAYLADENNPRHMQHALSQIEERIERGDPNARKFYPQIIASSTSATAEVRKTAAWVMGQDNTSEDFHRALVSLLNDSDPLVRRNAALQLVRFNDPSGRPELRAMLQPFEAKSPFTGTINSLLAAGSEIKAGGLLARIRDASGNIQEFRSPVDGAIAALAVKEGESVAVGETIASISPDRATVSDALRAFAYVGTKDDLPFIDALASNAATESDLRQEAAASANSIRSRTGH